MTATPPASPRRAGLPVALLAAIALVGAASLAVGAGAERIATSTVLFYLVKFQWAREGPPADVVVIGASQTVASIRPDRIEEALPPGTRVVNYGAPALAPTGGAALLQTYLEHHPPPRLVVLAWNPLFYTDRRSELEKYSVQHALSFREACAAARIDATPHYPLLWLASRIALVRYRDGLRTWLASLVFDRFPALEAAVLRWRGIDDDPAAVFRFRWEYNGRAARNAALVAELEASRGWHFWRENAQEGLGLRALREPKPARRGFVQRGGFATDPIRSFAASPRARAALERMFELCRQRGVAVQVIATPSSGFMVAQLSRDGGAERLDAFWNALRRDGRASVVPEPLLVYPNRVFSDPVHVDPNGARRYSAEIAPTLARAFREAGR